MAGGLLNIDQSWMGSGEYRFARFVGSNPVPQSVKIPFLMEPMRDKREPDPKMPSHTIYLNDPERPEIGKAWFKKGSASGQLFYSLEIQIAGIDPIYLNGFSDKDVKDGWRLVDQQRDDRAAA